MQIWIKDWQISANVPDSLLLERAAQGEDYNPCVLLQFEVSEQAVTRAWHEGACYEHCILTFTMLIVWKVFVIRGYFILTISQLGFCRCRFWCAVPRQGKKVCESRQVIFFKILLDWYWNWIANSFPITFEWKWAFLPSSSDDSTVLHRSIEVHNYRVVRIIGPQYNMLKSYLLKGSRCLQSSIFMFKVLWMTKTWERYLDIDVSFEIFVGKFSHVWYNLLSNKSVMKDWNRWLKSEWKITW